MTPTVIVLVGPPASGKSTHAKEVILKNPNIVRLNRDDFRMSLFGKQLLSGPEEKRITPIIRRIGREYLKAGFSIILDNTHVNPKTLTQVEIDYNDIANIEYIPFDVPYKTLIERNKGRIGEVPDIVIAKMAKMFHHLQGSFSFEYKPKKTINVCPSFIPLEAGEKGSFSGATYVFDIDSTLSFKGNRGIYDFAKAGRDIPIYSTLAVLNALEPSAQIVFVTGRPDSCREVTLEWLNKYCNVEVFDEQLYMRKSGDQRPSKVVKEEELLKLQDSGHNIVAWFDDDENVIDMVKEYGITTYTT